MILLGTRLGHYGLQSLRGHHVGWAGEQTPCRSEKCRPGLRASDMCWLYFTEAPGFVWLWSLPIGQLHSEAWKSSV